jgi:hypothetical protein
MGEGLAHDYRARATSLNRRFSLPAFQQRTQEENMTRKNEPREIVRYLQDGDEEQGFPCVVSHEDAGGECARPAVMAVYGLSFCAEHGEECADGAMEEMHQDADEFFNRFDGPSVPELDNPLILRAIRHWDDALLESDRWTTDTDELLLAAFPFRADRVIAEIASEVADPTPDHFPPYDSWRHQRYEMHQLMRHAYRLDITHALEYLEAERESIAAQCAYALALTRGDHPQVLERAHEENVESKRKVAEHLGK